MIRSHRHRRGYTAIEVLISMTLFAIGAAGVISMERVSIQGNADARRADVGAGIANEWLQRLRRDSMVWTEPNATVSTENLARTIWLKPAAVQTLAATPPADTGWLQPAAGVGVPGESNTYDVLGREVAQGSADGFFCVNYRLDWLVPPVGPVPGTTIRAEVRVFWPRYNTNPPASCAPATITALTAPQTAYHFMYATTTLRRNAE